MHKWWEVRRKDSGRRLPVLHVVDPEGVPWKTTCGIRVSEAFRMSESRSYMFNWCTRCDRIERKRAGLE